MKIKITPMPDKDLDSSPPEIARAPGIRDYSGVIDGFERTWREFVPSNYDPGKKYPLVVSLHGGASHKAPIRFAWAYIAEREGFLVLYPQCLREGVTWNVWSDYGREDGIPDDIRYIDELIAQMKEKYSVDEERIYIQGQSMGDMMTTTYILERGNIFAAAAPLSGPTGPSRFLDDEGNIKYGPKYRLPVIRTHGSEDLSIPLGKRKLSGNAAIANNHVTPPDVRRSKMEVHQLVNMYIWRMKNGCEKLPKLSVRGRYNVVSYPQDEGYDFIYYIVEGGEHGPYEDMADNIWTYFFSAYRRVNGEVVRTEANKTFEPDKDAVALADGADKAYVNNCIVQLSAPAKLLRGNMYVAVEDMAKLLPGASIEKDGEMSAEISCGGHTLQLAAGNRVVVLDEYLRDISMSVMEDGRLYVPAGDIAGLVLGYKTTAGHGVCYLSENAGLMSYDFAYIIRQLLGTEGMTEPKEWVAEEKKISGR